MQSHSICLFVTDLFHLASGPQGSSTLWHVRMSFLVRLNNNRPYFPYSPFDGYLGCLYPLAIRNIAVVNTSVQKSFGDPAFNLGVYIQK